MGLYTSQRWGRGTYLHTRVGPFFAVGLLSMQLVFWSFMVALKLLSYLLPSILHAIGAVVESQRRCPASRHRRAIAHHLTREAVEVSAEMVRREGLRAWTVYGVNDQFHVGSFPADEVRLARLYPYGRLTTVCLYPTSSSARKAAAGLTHHAFTVDELKCIFDAK